MNVTTFANDALAIATLTPWPAHGQIGMSCCPGKSDPEAGIPNRHRDLAEDLRTLRHWQCRAVITLLTDEELEELGVAGLGDQVRRNGMEWFHLPVPDFSQPTPQFGALWSTAHPAIGAILRRGDNILIHCRGGLGRTGTVAAQLLVELGYRPRDAVDAIRAALPGAIECAAQEDYVLGLERGARSDPLPSAEPEPPALPYPRDVPYVGVLHVDVDATDVERGILRCTEIVPVATGRLTLLLPKWLPGYHAPRGLIELFAGLQICAGGKRLAWRRDPVEICAFHVDIPEGCAEITLTYQHLSPTSEGQGEITVAPTAMRINWSALLLYPAGYFARGIMVGASLRLPSGWQAATALPFEEKNGKLHFSPVPLDRLIDRPVMAGAASICRSIDPAGDVTLHLFADTPDVLEAGDRLEDGVTAVVAEADRLFGRRPFRHFAFLVALSERLGENGVEHHCSAEIVSPPGLLTRWDATWSKRSVFAHEYVHAWNGKHRRGKDSWTPSFERPIRNSLMWVYEGLTQYLGCVLTTRAGLWTQDQALEALADTAARYTIFPGSEWRPLRDTTRDPIINGRAPLPWHSWQRTEDYYGEGQLIWLDADTLLRERSGGKASLDDFVAAFFGRNPGPTETYDFDDVVEAMEAIAPHDWRTFFSGHLERTGVGAPLDGLERGGYRLVYRADPNAYGENLEQLQNGVDLTFSIGLTVSSDGNIQDVLWGGPAYEAKLVAGEEILSVNERRFDPAALRQAVAATAEGEPLRLSLARQKDVRTVELSYGDGLRYPHLERIEGATDRLAAIFAPKR